MPLLSAGQAQKEITHNEALILLDSLICGCCAGAPSNDPPQAPEARLSYLCGTAPTAAWAGRPNGLACWTEGGWRFVAPFEGLQVTDRSNGRVWRFASGQWTSGIIKAGEVQINGTKVLGVQQPAIPGAVGKAVIDGEARSVLAQVLATLRAHGLIASAG
jgi:hypothetical protein